MSRELVYTPIKEFGKIVTGKTPKTENTTLWGGDVPFITPTDIPTFDTKFVVKTERTISKAGVRSQKNSLLPSNSLCVSCIATIGKICLTNKPTITNQQINSIIVNEKYSSDYLYYAFRYYLPYLQLIGGGTGSGTPIINKNKFSRLKYPVFKELNYQNEVASILSKYDELILNNNERISVLEDMAKALYKEWFVRFRFPGYEKATFENGLPKGWKIVRIKECCITKIGGDAPKNVSPIPTNEKPYSVFSNGLTNDGLYGYYDNYKIDKPSVTVSARGTVGFVCLRRAKYTPIVRLISLIPNPEIDLFYFYESLKYVDLSGNGTSQQQLTAPMIAKRKIIIASRDLILKFGKIVVNFFDEIENLKKQNTILAVQRDLLLPRLMSGKLSVEGKEIV